MIIYFTGTGNSRFAAKTIADITGDELFDSGKAIREKKGSVFEDGNTFVFVSPIYMSAPPKPFMDYIKRSTFPIGAKAYFYMTYGASVGAADRFCRNLCEEKGLEYMGVSGICMPQNYLIYFKTKTEEENRQILNDAVPHIREAALIIRSGKPFGDYTSKTMSYLIARASIPVYGKFFIKANGFRATDKCVGCSSCVSACPLGNIRMDDSCPTWGGECAHCTACINLCPQEAIEFGKHTEGKIRYHGPSIAMKA